MFSEIRSTKIAAGVATFVALLFGPLALAPVSAQVTGATLSGTVTDQSGAVVPKAGISIKNIATGVTRALMADPAGVIHFRVAFAFTTPRRFSRRTGGLP